MRYVNAYNEDVGEWGKMDRRRTLSMVLLAPPFYVDTRIDEKVQEDVRIYVNERMSRKRSFL